MPVSGGDDNIAPVFRSIEQANAYRLVILNEYLGNRRTVVNLSAESKISLFYSSCEFQRATDRTPSLFSMLEDRGYLAWPARQNLQMQQSLRYKPCSKTGS